MTDGLRVICFTGGLLCVLTAVLAEGVKVAGWELPVIESDRARIALGIFGAVLCLAAFVYSDVRDWLVRPRMRTYVVTTPKQGWSIAAPGREVKSGSWGGDEIEIRAADYKESDDGKSWIFTDRDGQPVRTLSKSQVADIRRREGRSKG